LSALRVVLPGGLAYWTVVNERYELVETADGFLRDLRFGADRTESTTRLYASELALVLDWATASGHDLVRAGRELSRFVLLLAGDAAWPRLRGLLFTDVGRRSVPPMIVAVVMVLQRLEGCSDREAVDRFAYDLRWKYAAGGLDFDYPGFVHTVLVDMRARLAASKAPDRVFEVTLAAARDAGLVGRRRLLDSTALFGAVATIERSR